MLAQAFEQQGRSPEARAVREAGLDVAEAAHITEWFVGSEPSAPPPAVGSDAPRGATLPAAP